MYIMSNFRKTLCTARVNCGPRQLSTPLKSSPPEFGKRRVTDHYLRAEGSIHDADQHPDNVCPNWIDYPNVWCMAPWNPLATYHVGLPERQIWSRLLGRGSISLSRSECGDPSPPWDGDHIWNQTWRKNGRDEIGSCRGSAVLLKGHFINWMYQQPVFFQISIDQENSEEKHVVTSYFSSVSGFIHWLYDSSDPPDRQ
jgi:hypothetical protein